MHRVALLVSVLGLVPWVGCQGTQTRVVGMSVEGRAIETVSLGRGHDKVLIMATIHGDEDAGTPLVHRLIDELEQHPHYLRGRRVVIMPIVNPDGMEHRTRGNAHGIDLNRNFPAGNFTVTDKHGDQPLSEPESRILKRVLGNVRPDRIVSIHQPLACIDWDGPGTDLAQAMGEWTDLVVKRLGSRPGSLGSYAGEALGIPIITLELPRAASRMTVEELWVAYGRSLLAAIVYPEPLDENVL